MPNTNASIASATESANDAAHALAACIAEYCRVTRATLENVRFLRAAIAPPAPELCTHADRLRHGGTGEWDEIFDCPAPGTVCNLADAHDADTPGALYCLKHHDQRERERTPDAPTCPRCGSADWMPADEGAFAACNDCGFTQYDDWTLEIIREVQREQKQAKQILGYVPSYAEAVEQGLAK